MRTAIDTSERRGCMATDYESPRLSVIVADDSSTHLDTVCKVLEFHDMVDLVGRAANFEETIQLVVTLRPDLVLMDIEMPSAMLAIAAIITPVADAHIVGMFTGCIPLDAAGLVPAVNAFIDKARLRNEFLPLLQAMHRYRGASSPPGRVPNNRRLSLVAR